MGGAEASGSRDVKAVALDGERLTIGEVVAVARAGATIRPLDGAVRARMEASRSWVEDTVRGGLAVVYGVNTGFGSLATERIDAARAGQLSRNVILKCVTGVGPSLPRDVVRAMMLVRANSLVQGRSGIRPALVESLIEMLKREVTPYVPAKGSLGASGDLAPQAHIAVVLTRGPGEEDDGHSGKAWYGDELLSGAEAMRRAGIPRLGTEAKEGLALTNGTAQMVATAALALHDAERLLRHAEIAAALSFEALLGLTAAFHPALHAANRQRGQVAVAERLRALLSGSRLVDSAGDKVQDAYSLRCAPQVLGPVEDTLRFLRGRIEASLNAAADNPLIFTDLPEGPRALSGGNFHGEGPALWLDFLGIAAAEIAGIAERRIFRLLTPELSAGLPAMLVRERGLNSGMMAAQYTAAALVSDNKTLAHPDSVDSIPSCANQEDHVSMGANAARHASEIVDNVRYVVAIELMTACQAIWLRKDGPGRLGRGTAAAYRRIRESVRPLERDRELTPDIEALEGVIRSGEILAVVEAALT